MTTTQSTKSTFRQFKAGDPVVYIVNLPYSYSESKGVTEEIIDGGTALVRYSKHSSARIPLRSLQHAEDELTTDAEGKAALDYESDLRI